MRQLIGVYLIGVGSGALAMWTYMLVVGLIRSRDEFCAARRKREL